MHLLQSNQAGEIVFSWVQNRNRIKKQSIRPNLATPKGINVPLEQPSDKFKCYCWSNNFMIDVCNSKKPTCCPRLVNSDPHPSQCRLTFRHLRAKNHIPQAPHKELRKLDLLSYNGQKNKPEFEQKGVTEERKVKTVSVNPSKTQTAMDLQQNCPCSQSPL